MLTKLQEIRLLELFISCFPVSVTPSINTTKSSNDFISLIILFISSFEVNKVNYFPALTAPFLLILLSKLFISLINELLHIKANILIYFTSNDGSQNTSVYQ